MVKYRYLSVLVLKLGDDELLQGLVGVNRNLLQKLVVLSGKYLDCGELAQAENQVRTFGKVKVSNPKRLEFLLNGFLVPTYNA
jgi:hypothetical protein